MGVASELNRLVRVLFANAGELDRVAVVTLRRFGLRLVEVLKREPVLVRRVEFGAELVRFFQFRRSGVRVDAPPSHSVVRDRLTRDGARGGDLEPR